MFASMAQIYGKIAKPWDDLDSLIYLICYLLNDCYLPWSGVLDKKTDKQSLSVSEMILQRANHYHQYEKEVIKLLPKELRTFYKFIKDPYQQGKEALHDRFIQILEG